MLRKEQFGDSTGVVNLAEDKAPIMLMNHNFKHNMFKTCY